MTHPEFHRYNFEVDPDYEVEAPSLLTRKHRALLDDIMNIYKAEFYVTKSFTCPGCNTDFVYNSWWKKKPITGEMCLDCGMKHLVNVWSDSICSEMERESVLMGEDIGLCGISSVDKGINHVENVFVDNKGDVHHV